MALVVETSKCAYVLSADVVVSGVLIHCVTELIASVVGRPMAVELVGVVALSRVLMHRNPDGLACVARTTHS